MNPENAKLKTERSASSAFEQAPAVTAPDQPRLDEQMAELRYLDRDALERVEAGDLSTDLEHLHDVGLEKRRGDGQLGTAPLHEVGRITPVRLRTKREVGEPFAVVGARSAKHATKLSVLGFATLVLSLGIGSCSGAQSQAEQPPANAPLPAQPASAEPALDSGTVSTPAPASEPLPLRAGGDAGPAANAGEVRSSACAADTIRRTLEEVVAQCKREGQRVCGELKVRASEDGKNIRVALDIAKDSFDDSFSRCVTSRLNAVAWRCTLPGSDTTLDLGCDL